MLDFFQWFAGDGRYHRLSHCLAGDWAWIAVLVLLDLSVFVGYCAIVAHWLAAEKSMRASPARDALKRMRLIFMLCSTSYLFQPVEIIWPAWRLEAVFLLALACATWNYIRKSKELASAYEEMELRLGAAACDRDAALSRLRELTLSESVVPKGCV